MPSSQRTGGANSSTGRIKGLTAIALASTLSCFLIPTPTHCGEEEPSSNVLLYENFDSGALDPKDWEQGKITDTPGRGGSGKALAAVPMPGNRYFGMGISRNLRKRPRITGDLSLFFYYRAGSTHIIKIQINSDSKNGNITYYFRSIPGMWIPMYIPFSKMAFDNGAPADEAGVTLRSINFYGAKPGTTFSFTIDDLCIFYGSPPAPIADETARLRAALPELGASLSKERFILDPGRIYRIKAARANSTTKPKPRTIARAGSTAAADSAFIKRLAIRRLKKWKFVSTSHFASRRKPLAWVKKQLSRYLPKDRPEIVFLMPGVEDLLAGVPLEDVKKSIAEAVDLCLQHGAAVILCSPPERLDVRTPLADAARKMSAFMPELSENLIVPFLDACAIANGDVKKNFSGLRVNSTGFKAINQAAADLIGRLERWAFDRGAPKPQQPDNRKATEQKEQVEEEIENIQL